ncbi:MAG: GNAT family N-acetyltransferase [Dehalococcoidia bacterium]|nr:GNAT family N-acetyltransferase [Dehalococcoidia bacterium]
MTNVRIAAEADRDALVNLVRKLLAELGGAPPSADDMSEVYHRFSGGGDAGFVVLGETGGEITAVCTVSFVEAMRSLGRYAIIQEMLVKPPQRSAGIGMEVLRFALNQAVSRGCRMVELGTPFHGDRQIPFYQRAGSTNVGARLRWRA